MKEEEKAIRNWRRAPPEGKFRPLGELYGWTSSGIEIEPLDEKQLNVAFRLPVAPLWVKPVLVKPVPKAPPLPPGPPPPRPVKEEDEDEYDDFEL